MYIYNHVVALHFLLKHKGYLPCWKIGAYIFAWLKLSWNIIWLLFCPEMLRFCQKFPWFCQKLSQFHQLFSCPDFYLASVKALLKDPFMVNSLTDLRDKARPQEFRFSVKTTQFLYQNQIATFVLLFPKSPISAN